MNRRNDVPPRCPAWSLALAPEQPSERCRYSAGHAGPHESYHGHPFVRPSHRGAAPSVATSRADTPAENLAVWHAAGKVVRHTLEQVALLYWRPADGFATEHCTSALTLEVLTALDIAGLLVTSLPVDPLTRVARTTGTLLRAIQERADRPPVDNTAYAEGKRAARRGAALQAMRDRRTQRAAEQAGAEQSAERRPGGVA